MKRTHIEPLPKGEESLRKTLQFVQRALTQPKVQKIEISSKGIEVVRDMTSEEEPVVPVGSDDVDVSFLLGNIELASHAFDPKQHPVYALHAATQMVLEKKRDVFAIVAPGWPLLAAWLGVDGPSSPPKALFGTKLVYVPSGVTNDRVVVLGAKSSSLFLSDVDFGVAVDLGV